MKYLLLFMSGALFSSLVAQDTTVSYLSSKWEESTLENAEYKRVLIQKNSDYFVVEDYLVNGLPYLRGQFHTADITKPFGEFVSFNEVGTITEVYNYNDSSELHGPYRTYDSEGRLSAERYYNNGQKDGLWKWFYVNGLISWFEQWRNDTLVMLQQFSPSGEEYSSKFNLNIAPKWKIENEDLSTFIAKRLPVNYRTREIYGMIYVYINSEGELVKVENMSNISGDLFAEIKRILLAESHWLPALNRLRPVDGILECEIMIPSNKVEKVTKPIKKFKKRK